jgi:hypothetical protein
MKKIFVLVLLSTLILPVQDLFADEDIDYQQMFAFFPDTTYESFGFFNLKNAREAEAFPIFKKLGSEAGGLMVSQLPPLPENFLEEAEYIVSAKIDSTEARQMRKRLTKKAASMSAELTDDSKSDEETEEKVREFENEWRRALNTGAIWSLYVPGVEQKIEQAVAAGYLSPTGSKHLDLPIYDVQVKEG